MRNFFLLILILISALLIVIILLQPRSGGAGGIFGSSGGEVYRTRRGFEKILHYITIFLVTLFSTVSLGLIFLH